MNFGSSPACGEKEKRGPRQNMQLVVSKGPMARWDGCVLFSISRIHLQLEEVLR